MLSEMQDDRFLRGSPCSAEINVFQITFNEKVKRPKKYEKEIERVKKHWNFCKTT